MKIVQINSTCGKGSTGKICISVSELLNKNEIENLIIYSNGNSVWKQSCKISSEKYYKIQALKSRIFGNWGFNSKFATKNLIKKLKEFKPDIVHIHNIHSHDVNFKLLFNYIRKNNIKTFYTFHDCWAFTGYCPHFIMARCDKWKTECNHCPQRKEFSWFFDKSRWLFNKKKKALSDLDLTIITPSRWLADLVKQSFLKDYPVKVINNGIDLTVFKPTETDFREKYNISIEKFILLGVAFGWGPRKGLDVFIELSKRLDKNKFQIVLVGTDNNVDKILPKEIISIHRTQNQTELAEIYSACDLFVNPTRQEVLGMVNIEANACGLPVVTFKTGGSPECINETSGSVVNYDDIDGLEKEIIRIEKERPFIKEDCINKAKSFDMNDRFKEYIELYKEI